MSFLWGTVPLAGIAIVGVPKVSEDGPDLGTWYSQKTVRPVDGFLGPDAFKEFRVEVDYAHNAVYFEKRIKHAPYDMDIVGLTLRPEKNGDYRVIGIAKKKRKILIGKTRT